MNIAGYKILKELGVGGMGKVFLAEDEMLDRKVAIKSLNAELLNDAEFIGRFQKEAKIQAKLSHQNIVTLYNFQKDAGSFYIIMEYVEGVTLSSLIEKSGALNEKASHDILAQALSGLGYAHKNNIVHRDIKPSNILIDNNGIIKIMDFGIAKIEGERHMTATGVKVGTLCYMSPEQVIASKDLDHRSDLYSLGIVFYEMLTGKLPFYTDTASDYHVMESIVKGSLIDPKELNPGISEKSIFTLNKLTANDRNNRFRSCEECLQYLLKDEGNYNFKNIPSSAAKTLIHSGTSVSNSTKERSVKSTATSGFPDSLEKSRGRIFMISGALLVIIIASVITFFIINNDGAETTIQSNGDSLNVNTGNTNTSPSSKDSTSMSEDKDKQTGTKSDNDAVNTTKTEKPKKTPVTRTPSVNTQKESAPKKTKSTTFEN